MIDFHLILDILIIYTLGNTSLTRLGTVKNVSVFAILGTM